MCLLQSNVFCLQVMNVHDFASVPDPHRYEPGLIPKYRQVFHNIFISMNFQTHRDSQKVQQVQLLGQVG